MLFNFLVNSTTNYRPLSDTILSCNPFNFHTLSLNSLTNPFADIPSIVATKYIIFNNLSQITRIIYFPATNSHFVIKSTIKYVYSFEVLHSNSTSLLMPSSYLLTYITLLHISPYISDYSWSPIVSYYQFCCLLSLFMSSCQYIIMQLDYLYSLLLIF